MTEFSTGVPWRRIAIREVMGLIALVAIACVWPGLIPTVIVGVLFWVSARREKEGERTVGFVRSGRRGCLCRAYCQLLGGVRVSSRTSRPGLAGRLVALLSDHAGSCASLANRFPVAARCSVLSRRAVIDGRMGLHPDLARGPVANPADCRRGAWAALLGARNVVRDLRHVPDADLIGGLGSVGKPQADRCPAGTRAPECRRGL